MEGLPAELKNNFEERTPFSFEKFWRPEYKNLLSGKVKYQNEKLEEEKKKKKKNGEQAIEAGGDSDDDESEYSSSEDEGPDSSIFDDIPLRHSISLNANRDRNYQFSTVNTPTQINAITVCDSGFVVGLNSSVVKRFEFSQLNGNYFHGSVPVGKMNSATETAPVFETAAKVKSVKYQPGTTNFLCTTNLSKFKLYNPEQKSTIPVDFRGGDQYLFDLRNTNGHTADVNDAGFNHQDTNMFATCSNDKTVRVWDIENYSKLKKSVDCIVHSKKLNRVMFCNENPRTDMKSGIITGDSSGKIIVWDIKGKAKPKITIDTGLDQVSSMRMSNLNGNALVTRGTTDVALFDLRNYKAPIAQKSLNRNSSGDAAFYKNCVFNNNDRYILTGDGSDLVVLDGDKLEEMSKITLENEITSIAIDYRLNQLLIADVKGQVTFGFNDHNSFQGILMNLSNHSINVSALKRKAEQDQEEWNIDSAEKLYAYEKNKKKKK
ncbi:hypothetical protein DASC09_058410 [Saccharomycopsis crataegensis]|uniref:Uncharacterized protein n=1 Tax=Saccharomycopsis crataegensis TaxID=43959 RepID=A0AAV5QUA9_9ASCO|nr:hypothetical protein DASC09_058410 [Saccharomycopsis crataegensis]